jgi:hypothetical protein
MVPAVLRDRTFLTGDWACTNKVASGVSNLIGSASAHFADLKSDFSKTREVFKKEVGKRIQPDRRPFCLGHSNKESSGRGQRPEPFLARGSEGAFAQTFLESEPKRGYEVILCHRVVRYGHLIAGADDQVFPFG